MTSLSVLCVSIATPALKRYPFWLKGGVDRMRKRLSEVEVAHCRCKTRLSAMLVRGKDHFRNFDDEPRPRIDYGTAERAVHADAVARFREANRAETLRYEGAS